MSENPVPTSTSTLRHVLVVGASLAGLRAAETLRAEGFDGRLTILGEEPHRPYDRPPLSKEILTGEMAPAAATLPVPDGLDADWRLGTPAAALDLARRTVTTADGDEIAYDGLVLATGSAPRTLPGLEPDGDRIVALRTLEDAAHLRASLTPTSRLLIVGCGFIGVEVASAARTLGAAVTMVALDPPLLPAGELAGATARDLLLAHDVDLRIGRTVSALVQDGTTTRAILDDETHVDADTIVVAVGAAPSTAWLTTSGLDLRDGVVCDAALRPLNTESVVAAGDVARWPNPAFGGAAMRIEHWTNAIEQGAAAARTLLHGPEAQPFASIPSFWSDHFGTRLQSVGLPRLATAFRLTHGTLREGRYAAAAYRDDELVGGITYGMPKALAKLRAELTRAATEVR